MSVLFSPCIFPPVQLMRHVQPNVKWVCDENRAGEGGWEMWGGNPDDIRWRRQWPPPHRSVQAQRCDVIPPRHNKQTDRQTKWRMDCTKVEVEVLTFKHMAKGPPTPPLLAANFAVHLSPAFKTLCANVIGHKIRGPKGKRAVQSAKALYVTGGQLIGTLAAYSRYLTLILFSRTFGWPISWISW